MIAIPDIDGRLIPPQFSIPGEFIDMAILVSRFGVFSTVRISFLSLSVLLLIIQKPLYYLDNGSHIDEITFSYFTYRSIRWTTHV
jgi:hypothetical protein